MGCDIHLYVEKRINGKWVMAQGVVKDEDGDINVPYPDKRYTGRNYTLFGFLAGVRDYYDVQHFKPRGFPKDASETLKKIYDRWEGDAHTPSYLTLKQLLAVDWENLKVEESGLMDRKQWKKLKASIDKGKPDWNLLYPSCQGTTLKTHIRFSVDVPIKWQFKHFYERCVDDLDYYDHRCKKHEIRIVFWFDN